MNRGIGAALPAQAVAVGLQVMGLIRDRIVDQASKAAVNKAWSILAECERIWVAQMQKKTRMTWTEVF